MRILVRLAAGLATLLASVALGLIVFLLGTYFQVRGALPPYAGQLEAKGLSTTVADLRFAKPLDEELVRNLVRDHEILVTVEEGAIGGFGTQVLHFLARANLIGGGCKVRTMFLPDVFVGHGSQVEQYEQAGLTAKHIAAEAMAALNQDTRALEFKTLA